MKINFFKKLTALSIVISLIIPVWGCGSNSTSNLSVVDNETVLSNDQSIIGADEVKKYPISDNGIPIWDFDEYVNGEWLKELEDTDKILSYKYDDVIELENTRLYDILNDDTLYNLSADDPLYKTKYIYDQFYSEGINDSLNESLLEFIAPIEEVSSLDELYDLYLKTDYSHFNSSFGALYDGFEDFLRSHGLITCSMGSHPFSPLSDEDHEKSVSYPTVDLFKAAKRSVRLYRPVFELRNTFRR